MEPGNYRHFSSRPTYYEPLQSQGSPPYGVESQNRQAYIPPQRDMSATCQCKELYQRQITELEHRVHTLQINNDAFWARNQELAKNEDSFLKKEENFEEEKQILTQQVKAYSRQCDDLKKTMFQLQEKSKLIEEQLHHREKAFKDKEQEKESIDAERYKLRSQVTKLLEKQYQLCGKDQQQQKTIEEQQEKITELTKENVRLTGLNQQLIEQIEQSASAQPSSPDDDFGPPSIPPINSTTVQNMRKKHEEHEQDLREWQQKLDEKEQKLEEVRKEVQSLYYQLVKEQKKSKQHKAIPFETSLNQRMAQKNPCVLPTRGYGQHQPNPTLLPKTQDQNQLAKKQPELPCPNDQFTDDGALTSLEDIPENKLIKNIDQEIQRYADEVREMTKRPTTAEVDVDDNPSLPYDPNLVCHKCGKRYHIGEIQKFKRHIKETCPNKK